MKHNKAIRDQVIKDLKAHLTDKKGQPLIAAFFSGRGEPISADEEGDFLEVPAIAVYMQDGEITDHFDHDQWQAVLSVEVMGVCSNTLDDELDVIAEKVLEVMDRNYNADGLLNLCNRKSFEYFREDGAPWGSLVISFNIEMETDLS